MNSETMNRNGKGIIAMALVIVALLISGFVIYSKKQQQIEALTTEKGSITETLAQRDANLDEMVNSFSEIEKTLDSIKLKRNMLMVEKAEGKSNQRAKIVSEISQLDAMIEESLKKIAQLEKRLKNSGIELKSFKKQIAELNQSIEKQNAEMSLLKQQLTDKELALVEMNHKVNNLSETLTMTSDTVKQKNQVIQARENEMNQAYVAIGTYKELKEKGLIDREGGFLRIGRSKTISKNLQQEAFTTLDIRNTKMIALNAQKVKIISEHPDSSYHLIEHDGMITSLEISDPAEFWKISKYALIETR